MNVEIEAEAAQFPEKEYINGIAVAVQYLPGPSKPCLSTSSAKSIKDFPNKI